MILIIGLSFSIGSCQQSEISRGEKQDLYLSAPSPYKVINFDNKWLCPDSLKSDGIINAVIDLFLNNKGKVEGMNLKLLKMDSLKYFEYSDKPKTLIEYPDWVKRFIPFITEQVSEIQIERDKEIKLNPKTKYLITLPVKLK